MSLSEDARRLLSALESIATYSELYAIKHKNAYIHQLLEEFQPRISTYKKAIEVDKSRELAKEAIGDLAEVVERISAASTKGEMEIVPDVDDPMEIYWELYIIFRESRYESKTLN